MKYAQRIRRLFAVVFLFAVSCSALASVQFTYHSTALLMQQMYVNGDEFYPEGAEPIYASFALTFSGNYDDYLLVEQADFSTSNHWGEMAFDNLATPASHLTLNSDGSVAAWKIEAGIKPPMWIDDNASPWPMPVVESFYFSSSYGPETCYCDIFKYETELYTPRPYETWAHAATLGFLHMDASSPDSWATAAEVSEPGSGSLMLLGLALLALCWLRRPRAGQ